jgi:hypothetical protein
MERKQRIAVTYGYAVCLVAIITFLITLASLVTSMIDMSDPFHSRYQSKENLASFENYKIKAMEAISKDAAYIPDDVALRKMYDAAKEEVILTAKHGTRRNMIVNGMILFLSIILFIVHWRWMQKIQKGQPISS